MVRASNGRIVKILGGLAAAAAIAASAGCLSVEREAEIMIENLWDEETVVRVSLDGVVVFQDPIPADRTGGLGRQVGPISALSDDGKIEIEVEDLAHALNRSAHLDLKDGSRIVVYLAEPIRIGQGKTWPVD